MLASENPGQSVAHFSTRRGPIWGAATPASGGQPLTSSALTLAASGLPVFACNSDKKSIIDGGFKCATRDPTVIREMFARDSAALIGVPTGRATDRVVIDIDPQHGGDVWFNENKDAIPPTLTYSTPHGGFHLIFRNGPELRNA